MTIEQFCEDLKDRLCRRDDGDAHEIATAIMDVVEPPERNHTSDCATSCAPAHMPGWCDCGAVNRPGEVRMTIAELIRAKKESRK